ncbi:hypothetical protein Hanom_Chr01g00006601 [Helianthus anomalus]
MVNHHISHSSTFSLVKFLMVPWCVPELKIPPHPSPPFHVFPNWKDYYQAKKTPFPLPSPPSTC